MTKKDTEKVEVEVENESNERIAFKQLIENFKRSNPRKYEIKKEELERKLAAIK